MKNLLLFFLVISMSCLLIACGTNQTSTSNSGDTPKDQKNELETIPSTEKVKPTEMEGYVVEKSSETELITPHPETKQPNAAPVYFSNVPDTLKIGDRVTISYEIMMESYPGQAKAVDVKVLDSRKPAGADLTEAQVLTKALQNTKLKTPILTKFQYNKESDKWSIGVENVMGETKELTIEDK